MSKLVAIINATPDSFSDGGITFVVQDAVARIESVISEGAAVVDIGAESTRPGATPLTHEQEWRRLESILQSISYNEAIISIDTRHAETAHKALELGVHWINDVSGFTEQAMIDVVKPSTCKLVIMHSLGVPADKNVVLPDDVDVIEELKRWIKETEARLMQAGISKDRLIFDPGIGFGKTTKQSWDIVNRIGELTKLGVPIYVGHSRKSFLGGEMSKRDAMTLEISKQLAQQGVNYLRVHNIAVHKELLAA